MNAFDFYKENKEYQKFVSDFYRKKARFDEMARQGTYSKAFLQQVSKQLKDNLQGKIMGFRQQGLDSIAERMEILENKKQNIGYADRPDEAKEFEIRFRVASDFELGQMASNLKTKDLLELSLLRMELKNRNMDDKNAAVSNYIRFNNLDGMDETEREEYNQLKEENKLYGSMSAGYVINSEGEMIFMSNIEKDMNQAVNSIPDNQTLKREIPLEQFDF